MRKTIASLSVAAALSIPALASAQQAPSPLTGNAGLFSQYIFRGLTQTGGRPAFQGGADYAHSSGAYLGTWLSNVSWLNDANAYKESSLEWDLYGGYKGSLAGDLGYDVGLLQYYYPGSPNPGVTRADTLEAYGGLSWKWLSGKLSYSIGNKTFGVPSSRGTYYLDLTATYPMNDTVNLIAHYGFQQFNGSSTTCSATGAQNSSCASYKDWKLGATYALPQAWTLGGYVTGTRMNGTQKAFYTIAGRELGKTTLTAYIQKTF